MIQVICRKETYIYNTYHMTKAFYPSAEVVSRREEKASNYVMVTADGETLAAVSEKDIFGEIKAEKPEKDIAGDPGVEKPEKRMLDKALYRQLKARTGRDLAWGILMGVRPTKLAIKKLAEGFSKADFVPWFMKNYLVSREKAELAWQIAVKEKTLFDKLDTKEGYSLYVGIPFCPTVCSYCSFSSGELSAWKDRIDEYLDALCRELRFIAGVSAGKRLNTVYIGGGTPTTLKSGQLDRLLSCIDAHFSREHLLEYTVEAGRPDSITKEKLAVIRNHGITRISINPQTMQQKTLDRIGRKHTVEEVEKAFFTAREMGFANINMDLIMGLPGETKKDVADTLKRIEALSPDNLTVHSLAIKRVARMNSREETGGCADIEQMINAGAKAAGRMGMSPYYLYRQKNIAGNFENVGYAKAGKAGIYNILIMEEVQTIVACGAGSVSKRVYPDGLIKRSENVKDVSQYIERIGEMIERKRVLI